MLFFALIPIEGLSNIGFGEPRDADGMAQGWG
jgi:hypothetical protein